jgi:arylsulfatase
MSHTLNRRNFLGASAALAGLSQQNLSAEGAPESSPNILVIHADQHRMDCIAAYGNPDIRTPHIDALAKDGARFENSFCPYPVCTASRYSLLSGQAVHQHQAWSNHSTLKPGTPTFATELRAGGYKTKAVGKMHFAPTYLDVGFDDLELSEQNGPGRWDDDYHRQLCAAGLVDRNDLVDQERNYRAEASPAYWENFGALPSNLPQEFHSTTWIGDRAADTIEQWQGGGNLLMAGFIKPHHPFDPPKEWCDAYDPEKLEVLPGWTEECSSRDLAFGKGYFPHETLNETGLRRVMAYYYATIEQIDQQVGRMVALLKKQGLYDNTLIVYTSDHGEYLGFHHMLLKGNHLYDPLAKVPLIIKYPKSQQAGTVRKELVNNIDVAPTLLREAGCSPPATMNGQDLRQPVDRDIVFSENKNGSYVMARTQTDKLLLTNKGKQGHFFDLERDPLEMNDLHADSAHQEQVKTLTQAVHDWRPFDSLAKNYLDEKAPIIQAPNAQTGDLARRKDMQSYFLKKMQD